MFFLTNSHCYIPC